MANDKVDQIVDEVVRIAGVLGLPVELDRPYDFDENELPLIIVRTGEEEVIEDDGYPLESWQDFWRVGPSIEVLVPEDDPWALRSALNGHWAALRAEIMNSSLQDLIRDGTKPGLRKDMIEVSDRSGIAGISVELSLEIERD
ncbi:hypothetical protein BMI91_19615 [Thioclava sediminum]|uniref:DUF3168 domain-containing protein n=1 Tax=Thioclava sediminum TaxID=1915319 RepID=A0ABX3MS17_9RHOB|nr:hypothetical protein [Thioclava sediminum]OOY22492.1 hypothetical protein BMI91_19615 [Thioclava sediminum]